MNIIELKNVNKYYGEEESRQHVLKNISLTVKEGEMVAIIGPSGSGKSTLLNILGLLDRQTSGEYFIEGKNSAELNEKERACFRNENIGFVFQSFNLLHELSALDNVKLNIQLGNLYKKKKVSNQMAQKQSKEMLMEMGLENHVDKYPAQLSGGQQQRVAIARAIVNNPAVILADEPTGALDTKTTREIMQVLKGLNIKGNTVIIVTHNMEVASQCDRMIEIRDGEIVRR